MTVRRALGPVVSAAWTAQWCFGQVVGFNDLFLVALPWARRHRLRPHLQASCMSLKCFGQALGAFGRGPWDRQLP
eukprot:3071939-Alexandrium_andersonii.AAC.1